jgi:uncharacterized radical SAM superfamily Fe-S cluster-containing enzyme
VVETRKAILSGERALSELVDGHLGEVKATLYEKGNEVWISKTCPDHGSFDDILSIDAGFSRMIEARYPGRDFRTLGDKLVHRHGTSSVRYGRGAVLTVDLTNRCNMMCNPCFMDANQVGYVHELTFEEVRKILDDSVSFKPRRQMVVQYSGGEPTMSPHFLEACAYAKQVGYTLVQAATNGLRFAIEPEFAYQAKEAGLDMVYLQFDGTTNESNRHRHISNLFDVKQIAIDNLAAAGVRITPVVTVVNGVNNEMVGPIFDYCMKNHTKMGGPAFQPVSFTGPRRGRDRRGAPAPALHDVAPRSRSGALLRRPHRPAARLVPARVGHRVRRAHRPPEGAGGRVRPALLRLPPELRRATMILHNRQTDVWAPITSFFDLDRFFRDLDVVVDSARGRALTLTQLGLSFLRNFDEKKAPAGMTPMALVELFNGKMGGSVTGEQRKKASDWRITTILSMWFQDLWNYDFRRTEMCVIPYGTQEGEISFCAYNTGVGWRNIIEQMRAVATTKDWYAQRGRHQIYAGDRPVALPDALKRRLPVVVETAAGDAHGGGCGTGCGCSSS